jgi:hypothetical protein
MGAHVQFLKRVMGAAGGDVERIGGREAEQLHPPAQATDVREAAAELFAQPLGLLWFDVRGIHGCDVIGPCPSLATPLIADWFTGKQRFRVF